MKTMAVIIASMLVLMGAFMLQDSLQAEDVPSQTVVARWMAYYDFQVPKERGDFVYFKICRPDTGLTIAKAYATIEIELYSDMIPPPYAADWPFEMYLYVPDEHQPNFKYKVAFENIQGHIGPYTEWKPFALEGGACD